MTASHLSIPTCLEKSVASQHTALEFSKPSSFILSFRKSTFSLTKSQPINLQSLFFSDSIRMCLPVPHPTSITAPESLMGRFSINHSHSILSVSSDNSSPYLQGSCPVTTFERLLKMSLMIFSLTIATPH